MARERRVRMSGQYGTIDVGRYSNGNTIIEAELLSLTNPDVPPERVRMVLVPMTGAAEDLLAALAVVVDV